MDQIEQLVLTALRAGELSGRALREKIAWKRSVPAFYHLMAGLEDNGLVHGRDEPKNVEGQIVKERRYQIGVVS